MNENQEIIIHEKQSKLSDFLKEENPNCLTCRWGTNGKCENPSCLDCFNKSIFDIELTECDYRYSIYDDEVLMSKRNDDEYEKLFEDLT